MDAWDSWPSRRAGRAQVQGKYLKYMSDFDRMLRVAAKTAKSPHVSFLAGDQLSFADICLFDAIEAIEAYGIASAETRAEKFPHCDRLFKHVLSLPKISAYLKERAVKHPRFTLGPFAKSQVPLPVQVGQ